MMRAALWLSALAAAAVHAGDPQRCIAGQSQCPAGMSCDTLKSRCYHTPRRLGEPCGKVVADRKCAPYHINTTHPMSCSTLCGVCLLDDPMVAPVQQQVPAVVTVAEPAAQETPVAEGVLYLPPRHRAPSQRRQNHTACGVASPESFMNFEESLVTSVPVVYPQNDADLAAVFAAAAGHACVVRPVGASHSSPAVVVPADVAERQRVVAVSLAEYVPADAAWGLQLLPQADGSMRVRAPAGTSLFDLYKYIRPRGYFLPSQTAGPIFTLGGILSNSVHGGVHGKGYLHTYLTGVRAAVWDPAAGMQIQNLTDEATLRHWRNSYGLLGVMTAVELVVEKRDRFTVTTEEATFTAEGWTREAVDAHFAKLIAENTYSESFFDPYQLHIKHVLFRTAPLLPDACQGFTSDDDCTWNYAHARCNDAACCSYQFVAGDLNLGQSCRLSVVPEKSPAQLAAAYESLAPGFASIPYNGAPGLTAAQDRELCMLEGLDEKKWGGDEALLAKIFYDQTYDEVGKEVEENAGDVNDGFWLRAVPHYIRLMAYSVPRGKLFDFLNLIKELFVEISEKSGRKQLANVEFRFLDINDTATLLPTGITSNAVVPGEYVNCEVVFNTFPGSPVSNLWRAALAGYEARVRALDGVPHTGKSFCYAADAAGVLQPYRNATCVQRVFNEAQKTAFNEYRQGVDPARLFDGGAAELFFK